MNDPRWTVEDKYVVCRSGEGDPGIMSMIDRAYMPPAAWDALVAVLRDADRRPDLDAENERHRKANLVRAVTDGIDPEWVSDIIAAEGFDAVPWKIADSLTDTLHQARQRYAQVPWQVADPTLKDLLSPPVSPDTPTPTGDT